MSEKSKTDEMVHDAKAFKRYLKYAWKKRATYIKYSIIGAILSLVVSFSIPKTYSATVVLAPEPQTSGANSGISNLASMAGVNMGGDNMDAYTVDLYPTLVQSTDFALSLGKIKVKPEKVGKEMTYAEYLLKHTEYPWWTRAINWVKSLFSDKSSATAYSAVDNDSTPQVRRLSEAENAICERIKGNVQCSVEDLTGVVSITVHDQDPVIAAMVVDTVAERLNKFVLDYRTKKARAEYEHMSKLSVSLKNEYLAAQERYIAYARSHTSVSSPVNIGEMEILQNEVSLAYTAYNDAVIRTHMAEAKILESTPVYAVVDSAYVPLSPSSPRKVLMLIIFVLFSCVVATVKLAYVKIFPKKNGTPVEVDTADR